MSVKTNSKKNATDYEDIENKFEISLRSALVLVFLCSFLCYSNTLQAGFVYDDTRAILANQDLHPAKPLSNIFYNDFWGTPLSHSGSHKSYRPLCVLTFRLNYLFGELNPFGYHLVNVILHGVVSCLFAVFCFKLFKKEWLAFVGGLLFSTHPIHTEAVAGVVGRADVGSALLFLCALLSYQNSSINRRRNVKLIWFLLSLIFSICSMFTKEQGVTVLGVIVAYEMLIVSKCNFAFPKTVINSLQVTGGLKRVILLVVYAFLILYTRVLIMGHAPPSFSPADNPAANEVDFLTRFLTFLYLPYYNLWLLIYPWQLSYDYSMGTIPLVNSFFSYENILSAILYSSLLFIAYSYLKHNHTTDNQKNEIKQNKNRKHTQKVIHTKNDEVKEESFEDNFTSNTLNVLILSLAAMILPFLPATNMFFYVGFVVAERILYIPSIGFCLLLVNGLNVLMKKYVSKRKHILVMVAAVLVMFGLRTYLRNFVWQDEESLYRSGIATSPAKSYGNLANVLVKQNKTKEAEEAYRSALKFRSNMADSHYNLGILLQNQNRYEEAIKSYKDAIKYRPRLAAAHLNLGVTLTTIKRKEEALEVLMNAYNISDHGLKDPHAHSVSLTNIRYNTGRVMFEMGKNEEAIEVFLDALKRMPDDYEPHSIYNMIGQVYAALENDDYAEAWYARALHSKKDHVPALLTYAKHLSGSTDPENIETAEKYLVEAIRLEPMRVDSYLLYGKFLSDNKRTDKALNILKELLGIDSNNIQALSHISSIYRESKDYNKALKYQLMAKKLDPTKADIMMNLGGLYHLMGKLEEASLEYQTALKYSPDNELLLTNIKRLERAMNNKNK